MKLDGRCAVVVSLHETATSDEFNFIIRASNIINIKDYFNNIDKDNLNEIKTINNYDYMKILILNKDIHEHFVCDGDKVSCLVSDYKEKSNCQE